MDQAEHETEPLSVRIVSDSHAVLVRAEDRGDVAVDGQADVHREGRMVTVSQPRGGITVRVPVGSDVVVGARSGRVEVVGPVGHAAVSSQSGRVQVTDATSADVRADSGRVDITGCAEECRVRADSGQVKVKGCGAADVTTRSGRISLSGVRGDVRAHCVSGRVRIQLDQAADVDAETVSGRIDLTYPAGVTPTRDDGTAPAPDGGCVLHARSVSGRVTVGSR